MAVVAPFAFLLLIGIMDIGVAIWSYNVAAEAAREAARQAVVHGSKSGQLYGPAANDANVDKIERQYAIGLTPANVTVRSTWPNGNNKPGSPVTVEVEYVYTPCSLFQLGTLKLRSRSTMT